MAGGYGPEARKPLAIRRDNFKKIDVNDLAASLKFFEIELALNQIEANVDKLRAAVLVFPQSIVEGFQNTFPEVKQWQYNDFHNYVLNKLPQHYSCHRHHKFPMSPTLLDLENVAMKDAACPKDELYKFFVIYRAPTWAKDLIRKHVRLDVQKFKEKVDDILSSERPYSQQYRYSPGQPQYHNRRFERNQNHPPHGDNHRQTQQGNLWGSSR